MKIALITLEYPPHILGGSGIYITQIVPQISYLGHEIHILAPGLNSNYEYSLEEGVHVHRLPINPRPVLKTLSYWAILPWAFHMIDRNVGAFDLIHSNGISDLTLNRLAAGPPRVVTVHHLSSSSLRVVKPSLLQRLRQPGGELGLVPYLEPISIRRAHWIVAVSEYTRADLVTTLGLDPARVTVIRHGARLEDYRFRAEELTELRAQLAVGIDPLILCVGRLEPRKGIATLIRAFAQVLQTREARLVLVGAGTQESYRALAARLGVDQRVIFMGHVDSLTLRKLYAACDLFAFPSLLEGLGLVALEARAAGKFVVASNVGGIPEVVPSEAGYLVPPSEVAPLAWALLTALREPHTDLPSVQSWAQVGQQLCKFYRTAIAQ